MSPEYALITTTPGGSEKPLIGRRSYQLRNPDSVNKVITVLWRTEKLKETLKIIEPIPQEEDIKMSIVNRLLAREITPGGIRLLQIAATTSGGINKIRKQLENIKIVRKTRPGLAQTIRDDFEPVFPQVKDVTDYDLFNEAIQVLPYKTENPDLRDTLTRGIMSVISERIATQSISNTLLNGWDKILGPQPEPYDPLHGEYWRLHTLRTDK